MKVAIAILAQNEQKQIPRLVKMLKRTDADEIYWFDDHSTDEFSNSLKLLYYLKPSKWVWTSIPNYSRFEDKKNYIHSRLKKFKWVVHIDADEVFDQFFLKNIKTIIRKMPKTLSMAFKRLNIPRGENYPDYQVRLLKIDPDIEWRGKYHEKPYSKIKNKSLLDIASKYSGNVNDEGIYYCITLEEFPIIHLQRRTDIKRPWW